MAASPLKMKPIYEVLCCQLCTWSETNVPFGHIRVLQGNSRGTVSQSTARSGHCCQEDLAAAHKFIYTLSQMTSRLSAACHARCCCPSCSAHISKALKAVRQSPSRLTHMRWAASAMDAIARVQALGAGLAVMPCSQPSVWHAGEPCNCWP